MPRRAFTPDVARRVGALGAGSRGEGRPGKTADRETTLPRPVRVFLVDDHDVVRRGLRDLIEAEDGLIVVGEAASAVEALELAPQTRPDIAVLDVCLPGGDDGIELCRELRARNENLKALMLTSFDDDEALLDAMMAGASGYALKQLRGPDLVDAIRRVAAGENLLDPSLTGRLLEREHPSRKGEDDSFRRLTPQEHKILELIVEGCTNRQIADKLFLAEKTVKNYVSNMMRKLGVKRRTEAAVYATRLTQRRQEPSRPPRSPRADRRS